MKTTTAVLIALMFLPTGAYAQFSEMERRALSEPFRGLTADGTVTPGLFRIESTGVSTAPVRIAPEAFLAGLTDAQRQASTFAVDDDDGLQLSADDISVQWGLRPSRLSAVQNPPWNTRLSEV